jgi:hypothetical protein
MPTPLKDVQVRFPGTAARVASLTVLAVIISASPALAEGSFTSSLSNVLTGFNSRSWTDKNSDGTSTRITLSQCTDPARGGKGANTRLQLTRERGGVLPDKQVGDRKTFYCSSSAYGDWGRVARGKYHFTVILIDGQERGVSLSAKKVVVRY